MRAGDNITLVAPRGAVTPMGTTPRIKTYKVAAVFEIGMSCLIPLMEAGFVDWIISTGANLYHDAHFALGLAMHRGHAAGGRRRAARARRGADLRHLLRLQRAALHRRVHPRGLRARGVPAPDEHGGVSLPAGRLRPGAGEGAGALAPLGARRGARARGPDLHQLAGRQLDRHERRRAGAGRAASSGST